MISKGQLKGMIWRYLNKTADRPGFYTSDKLDDAIEEALISIAVAMFEAGEGWLTKYIYLDAETGQVSLDIPGNVALVREVRLGAIGGVYTPMVYDDRSRNTSYVGPAADYLGNTSVYRILGNQIIFDPPLSTGGEQVIQIEAVYLPKTIVDDDEVLDPQFGPVAIQYLKYRVCSILAGSIEKTSITWGGEERKWESQLTSILNRRVLTSTVIREFI
jgi:hypothetical protein